MRPRLLLPVLLAGVLMALALAATAAPMAPLACPNPEGCCNNNNVCEPWEDGSCSDCDPWCGDQSCNGAETCGTCAQDCGACPSNCNFNGQCGAGESCSSCPADCDPPPAFTISPHGAAVGQQITFSGIGITDPAPSWDLGNGTHLVGNPLPYAYSAPGPARARLTATDASCNTTQTSDWQYFQITSAVCNQNGTCESHLGESCATCAQDCGARPAFSVSDDSPFVDQPVTFAITNPEQLVTTAPIVWHYGDGAFCNNCGTSSAYDYPQPGIKLAKVVATEAVCGSVQTSAPVMINVLPATASPHVARFVSQSVPDTLHPGETAEVRVTMKNFGSSDWTDAQGYFLGSANPLNNWTWGLNRVPIGGVVGHQDVKDFVFTITAPSTPGYYNFQWRMLQENVEWFGDTSPNVAIRVGNTDGDAAAFLGHTIPTELAGGETVTATITVENTGTTDWTRLGGGPPDGSQGYKLAVLSGQLFTPGERFELDVDVPQGGQHEFEISVRMPLLTIARAEFQMVHEGSGYFGPKLNVTVRSFEQLPPARIAIDPDHGSAGTVVNVAALDGFEFPNNAQVRFSFGDPRGHAYSRIPVTTTRLSPSLLQFTLPPEAVDCGAHYVAVTSSNQPLTESKKFKLQSPCDETRRSSLDVLAYNVHLLPVGNDDFQPNRAFRAHQMVEHQDLRGHDVFVVVEAMDDTYRFVLKGGLRNEYPYQTKVVAEDGGFCGWILPVPIFPVKQDGGVLILSKWPIEDWNELDFEEANGPLDECAKKGVMWAKINKAGRRYNVFGTHLDADDDPPYNIDRVVRIIQLSEMRDFVDSRGIPADEPVIFAGDFNIDESKTPSDFNAMVTLLAASAPPTSGGWPPGTNLDGDWIDYVLSSNLHLQPTPTSTPVSPFNQSLLVTYPYELQYLSDHFAVLGRFRYFGAPPPSATCATPPAAAPLTVGPVATTGTPQPLFVWAAAQGATSYDLRVARAVDGASVLELAGIGGTSYQLTAVLPADTALLWTVTGVNECGAGPASAPAAVEVRQLPNAAPIQAPTLLWPAGALADPRPTFRWSAVAGAATYTVFAKREDGAVVFHQSGVPGNSFAPASALPLHTPLRWGVASHNAWGDGPSSDLVAFSIDPGLLPVPAPPVPGAPSGCTTSARPTLQWNASPGAVTYQVAVNDLTDGTSLLDAPGLYHTSFTPISNLPSGRPLTWRVRACTYTECSAWSAPREFRAACTAASAPEPLSPAGCIQAAQPTLMWTAIPGAAQYAVEVHRASDGVQVYAATVGSTSVTMPTALSAWTEYWFRVRTSGGATWSPRRYFWVHCMPEFAGTASPLAPAEGSSTGSLPLFRWEAALNASGYYLEIGQPGTGARGEWLPASAHCAGSRCAAHASAALALGASTWRVKARNTSGEGRWSPTVSFTVSSLSTSPWNVAAVADFDRDEQPDILWQHESSGDLEIWTMDGSTRTAVVRPSPDNSGGADWEVAAAADFDGDKSTDILWQRRQTNELVVWFMDGAVRTSVASPTPDRPSSDVENWKIVASGAYDWDEQPDLLWQHRTEGYLVAWAMNGIVKSEALFPVPNRPADDFANWKVMLTDALAPSRATPQQWLWQQQVAGWLVVWNMQGVVKMSSGFPTPNIPDTHPGDWKVVGSGDFSGDGNVDLVFRNRKLGATSVWIMNGTTRTGTVALPAH